MFEVLLELDVVGLTPKKINTILINYQDHEEYDLIFSYVHAVRQSQVAQLNDNPYADKEAVKLIVGKIQLLLKNVQDPALLSLRKEFLTEKGEAKAVASIPHSVFRCATLAIVAVFQITDAKKRQEALPHLNGVLNALKGAFNAFQYATDFNSRITQAIQTWQGEVLKDADTKIAAIRVEKESVEEELKKWKEDSASASGKTNMSTRVREGKPPHNPMHDAITMHLYWRQSKVTVFELLLVEYQLQIMLEKKINYMANGGSTHRSFINGHSEKISDLLAKEIDALCDETKDVKAVVLTLKTHEKLRALDINNRLNIANKAGLLADSDAPDPVPGFAIPADKKEDQKYIMTVHQKLSRIANMRSNKENTNLLPYDAKSAETFKEHVKKLEQEFPSLASNGEKKVNKLVN